MPLPRIPSLKGEKVSVSVETRSVSENASSHLSARFKVKDLLGEGGMGSVFVAHDRGLGRVVALKRLRDGLEKDEGALRRFMLEAQIGAQLEHPNIVPLYSFERSDTGMPAIAMQLLEGVTMSDYIRTAAAAPVEARAMRGEYSLKQRLQTLLGVCEAIHFAHERGVIHRDLKPDNVMLGGYGEVYLMDWGLARIIGSSVDMTLVSPDRERTAAVPEAETEAELAHSETIAAPSSSGATDKAAVATRQGDVMGTAQYMPPEQALGLIDQLGPAADQYSLGVMLQELATLLPARSHTSSMLAFTQALQNQLAPLVDVDGAPVHPALAAIVTRATQREPVARYASVSELAADIRRFVRDEPVSVYREGLARRSVRAAARRPVLAMAILSVVGFLASVAIVGATVRQARAETRHARVLDSTQRAIVAVTDRAHAVDVELSDISAGVIGIAAAGIELLDRGVETLDHSGSAPPALAPSSRYGGAPVSFEGIVVTWPGKAPGVEPPPGIRRLEHLERWLRQPLIDALPEAARAGTPAEQLAALAAGKSALLRTFVALADGTFAQFPARDVPSHVDPLDRPWYRHGATEPGVHWMRPISDATKRTVRMAAVLGMRSRGQLVGVAGCDLGIATLAPRLDLALPGFRRAYLVTEDGKIAVARDLEAAMLAQVQDVDLELPLPSVDVPELAAKIAKQERGGYVVAGERLLVFSRMISLPWTYVAELERSRYLDGD